MCVCVCVWTSVVHLKMNKTDVVGRHLRANFTHILALSPPFLSLKEWNRGREKSQKSGSYVCPEDFKRRSVWSNCCSTRVDQMSLKSRKSTLTREISRKSRRQVAAPRVRFEFDRIWLPRPQTSLKTSTGKWEEVVVLKREEKEFHFKE